MLLASCLMGTSVSKSLSIRVWQGIVTVQWTENATNVAYFNVYRSLQSGGPYTLWQSNISQTSYNDTAVQIGGTYYYVVTAVDNSGVESAYSNEAVASLK